MANSSFKGFGVEDLGVIDARVIPAPLAAQYQRSVFDLDEQAVDIILADRKK